MDIELLFSTTPFMTEGGAAFSLVSPTFTKELDLSRDDKTASIGMCLWCHLDSSFRAFFFAFSISCAPTGQLCSVITCSFTRYVGGLSRCVEPMKFNRFRKSSKFNKYALVCSNHIFNILERFYISNAILSPLDTSSTFNESIHLFRLLYTSDAMHKATVGSSTQRCTIFRLPFEIPCWCWIWCHVFMPVDSELMSIKCASCSHFCLCVSAIHNINHVLTIHDLCSEVNSALEPNPPMWRLTETLEHIAHGCLRTPSPSIRAFATSTQKYST